MADDMRVDDLRFMPHVRHHIAARGLNFRNSFSPYPLCCPARASFLTGQYPHNHQVLSNLSPYGFAAFDDRATLATSLHDAGYRTGFIGKYLNGYGAAPSVVTGRRSWHYVPAGWTDWYGTVELPEVSRYRNAGTYHYFRTIFNVNGATDDSHLGEYQTHVLGRFTRDLIRKYAGGDGPFFVYLSALAPHTGFPHEPDDFSWAGPEGERQSLATPARPRWVRGHFDTSLRRSPGLPTDGGSPEADVSDKPLQVRRSPIQPVEAVAVLQLARQRAEALHVLDLEVARVIATLKTTGAWENTVIIFTSDNGYLLGEHRLRFAKTLPYEPSLRVPFLISGPGVPPGERFDPVKTPDLTATILDLAGASAPHAADGSSLLPTIRNGDQGWNSPVVTEALFDKAILDNPTALHQRGFHDPRTLIGIRTARYKLVKWATGSAELYDLRTDPNELSNRAADPRYSHVLRQLNQVWREYKDCRAAACSRPLPLALRVGPGALATLTQTQSDGVRAMFGVAW